MSNKYETICLPGSNEIIFKRELDAPVNLVWDVWTDPEHLIHWWGPDGFTHTFQNCEIREGGSWQFIMHGPDGTDYPNYVEFLNLEKPKRILMNHGVNPGEDWLFIAEITFEDLGTKTFMTMKSTFKSAAERDDKIKNFGALEGGEQHLDRFANRLKRVVSGEKFENEFTIYRNLKAPRDLVWDVWTNPEHLSKWFGPKGFKMLTSKVEFQPGGTFHYQMISPEGHEMWGKFIYKEIRKPELLSYVVSFSDENGNILRHPLSETWPLEVLNTMILTEHKGITRIVLKGKPVNASEIEIQTFENGYSSMRNGFKGMIEQLEEYLASLLNVNKINKEETNAIVINRIFDAPVEIVWRAWSVPSEFMKWWGPKPFTSPSCEIDFRLGGKFIFCMQSDDGKKYYDAGVYTEIIPLSKIAYKQHFADSDGNYLTPSAHGLPDDWDGHSSITVTFENLNGKTKFTLIHSGISSEEVSKNTVPGWNSSFDKLSESL